jgi:predicted dehydrogenase
MQRQTVRSGLVGAGFAADFHFESVKRVHSADVEVVGVYDSDPDRAAAFAKERGLVAVDSLEELIDTCDVVHACVPPVAHEPVAVAALKRDTFVIVEKPFTGYFGDGSDDFNGQTFSKETMLEGALASIQRMLDAEQASQARICYAENFIYAPAIQKEREIIEKSGAQILWMNGEEGHAGSHSPVYGIWKFAGGGSLMGKSCHPLSAILYFKRVEGRNRLGEPIRPKAVSARTHRLTANPNYDDKGHLRSDYEDVEDFGHIHIVFDDGMVADVFASEILLGGVRNRLEVAANNHRTICNINPNTVMQTYNEREEYFKDIYVVEKTGTKQGWSNPAPDEDYFNGYPNEMEAFYRTVAYGEEPEGSSSLGADTIAVIYSAYLSDERGGAEVEVKTL